ncbi:aminotransferase class I/II-fold pyridoxal phosphate-dependent enzyme [Chitinophaga nivalis]|uniref:Pyridoxal phosphate-dependent aminotransferase family protein n=1 Tax=Chitinophaga nivalis TaxID=2991709 RepID=A0ABT3IPF3_9BACT|nr:pyridoxal phosphate-dependent aminotransferase family protein [Chitinophaga nivalis]MCW3464463.1 pyridoxal phosphate-dependent aminotransferase family protein [Chitinophaga nivalis]MCW3485846.1 pyridoxal phosphate-dependent aminotransferase family protein [Chitinophaga nivalis]
MNQLDTSFMARLLDERRVQQSFRQLRLPAGKVDFCSNDYLGLARNADVRAHIHTLMQERFVSHGSTGSRLLAGNYEWINDLETDLATFHAAEAGLLYNSGYDANLGLFSCIAGKTDTIIYDQLIHASIRDGIRLSVARSFAFRHNDPEDLEKKLRQATGKVFVAVESVYSMDGDEAPLADIAALCHRYQAYLIVDEAHATGITGEKGAGLVQALGLQDACLARVHTFGKAVGCHGAIILGPAVLRDYLINFSRSFIYTTSLPPAALAAIAAGYSAFPYMQAARHTLQALITRFRAGTAHLESLPGTHPIQVVMTRGNENTRRVAATLQEAGLDVRPILHPTVPLGTERLRIVIHSFNTTAEVDQLIKVLS